MADYEKYNNCDSENINTDSRKNFRTRGNKIMGGYPIEEVDEYIKSFRKEGKLPDDAKLQRVMLERLYEMRDVLERSLSQDDNRLEQPDSYKKIEGLSSREKFKRYVKTEITRDEVKWLAYKKRENGKNFHVDSFARNYLPKTVNEPEIIANLDEWVDKTYKYDLKIIKRALEIYREEGHNTEQINKQIDLIEEEIANGGRLPEWDDSQRFPTSITLQGPEFIHYSNPKNVLMGFKKDVECRLYMCPRTDNMVELIDEFKNKCKTSDLEYKCKFSRHSNRMDRFIIFTNYDDVSQILDVLKDIKREKPELFKDMEKRKNPFWGRIKGINEVFYGNEPAQYSRVPIEEQISKLKIMKERGEHIDYWDCHMAYEYNPPYSYNSLISKIFDNAFEKWGKEIFNEKTDEEIGIRWLNENHTLKHFSSPNEITDHQADRLIQIFHEELDRAEIDPDNFAFDKYPDKTRADLNHLDFLTGYENLED